MGFNFPNSPAVGDKYPVPAQAGAPVWQWNGSAWVTVGGQGLGGIYISDIVPAGAPDNSLWWESDTGNLYIRYNDGDSSQWVIVVPATSLTGLVRYDTSQGLTAAQATQGRQNLYAAPFDAMGWSGMQVNGSMEVSQERGSTAFAMTSATSYYIQDGWSAAWSGTAGGINAIPLNPGGAFLSFGFQNTMSFAASTGVVLGASNVIYFIHTIEGYRVARLAWGTANAQSITIGFWANSVIAGTLTISVTNSDASRVYLANIAISGATPAFYTVTIPGDTAGTWLKTNGAGLQIRFCLGAGSNNTTGVPGSWGTSNILGTSSTTNFMAATNNQFNITGVVVLPGIEAPSAARSPLIMRPYDQELVTCRRYFYQPQAANCYVWPGMVITATSAVFATHFPVQMRIAPTFGYSAVTDYAVNTPSGQITCTALASGTLTTDYGRITATTAGSLTVGYGAILQGITANGQLKFDARL